MIDQLERLLKITAPYWSQITALSAVVGTTLVAVIKVLTDRMNKRDELRYGELLKIRNSEVKNYSQAMSDAFGKLNMLTVVIVDDKEDMRRLRNEFLEVHNSLVKAFVTLHFFIPSNDEKKLELFHDIIIGKVSEAAQLLSHYINNRITTRIEFENQLMSFTEKLSEAGDAIDEVTPTVQSMIRSYNGVERKWWNIL